MFLLKPLATYVKVFKNVQYFWILIYFFRTKFYFLFNFNVSYKNISINANNNCFSPPYNVMNPLYAYYPSNILFFYLFFVSTPAFDDRSSSFTFHLKKPKQTTLMHNELQPLRFDSLTRGSLDLTHKNHTKRWYQQILFAQN